MAIMDSAWNNIEMSDIVTCWIKSTCTPYDLQSSLQQLAKSLGRDAHDQSFQGHDNNFKELIELSSKLDLASAPATPIAVLHNVSQTHSVEIKNIVEMEIAAKDRYQKII